MDRKDFLVKGTMAAFAVSIFGTTLKAANGSITGDCDTTNDILGPYYRAKSPVRADLTYEGLKGTRLLVSGKVFTDDCKTVLKNAAVEVWHCSNESEYDNRSKEYRHRGQWITGDDGAYSFKTIVPGKYLNGELYRPAHIHFRVTAPGHKELVSQIYFKGDPHITEDPWASDPKAISRILPISPLNTHGDLAVIFDIHLQRTV
ncbi:MAG: intradiol ring-cleavage dioxygenase [Bacteroidetes bacterium]|nr:MAG: intradiol ring-cleavage dioxygenase [Bacteroidota bacterium]